MTAEKLDPREEHFRIASHHPGRLLFLRYLAPGSEGQRVATHLMHLESSRCALYDEAETVLTAGDVSPAGE